MFKLLRNHALSDVQQTECQLLNAAHSMSMDAQVVFDETGKALIYNNAWINLVSAAGHHIDANNLLAWFPEIDLQQVFGPQRATTSRNVRLETHIQLSVDMQIPVELSLLQFSHEGNNRYSATIRDITLRKNHEQSLAYKADHDVLTGLPNRAFFFRSINRMLNQPSPPKDGAMILFDLQHFKEINDVLGTEVGDKVLAIIGERLQVILGEDNLIARLGGDKFCIFCESAHTSVQKVTRKLARVTQQEMDVRQIKVQCSFNAGISLYPSHGKDARTLFNCADTAMQQAKQSGKEFVLFQSQSNEKISKHQTLSGQLSEAIQSNELTLLYQPMVSSEDGQPVSVEALIRWQHPVYGLLGPSDFLGIAECTHLIRPLAHWAIQQGLRDAREWEMLGLSLRVAINLSAVNLLDVSFAHSIEGILKQHSNADRLQLEITEQCLMADPCRTAAQLNKFAMMHIPLVIDDFGSSYTSLTFLKTLPIACLKIDRSLIESMHNSEKDYAMVESMINMGHSLGIPMAAIGVESKEQVDSLKLMKCDLVQGYYFSRPLSSKDLMDWLQESEHRLAG